jgi:hypothetical protein
MTSLEIQDNGTSPPLGLLMWSDLSMCVDALRQKQEILRNCQKIVSKIVFYELASCSFAFTPVWDGINERGDSPQTKKRTALNRSLRVSQNSA